jgi:hypothetical protein
MKNSSHFYKQSSNSQTIDHHFWIQRRFDLVAQRDWFTASLESFLVWLHARRSPSGFHTAKCKSYAFIHLCNCCRYLYAIRKTLWTDSKTFIHAIRTNGCLHRVTEVTSSDWREAHVETPLCAAADLQQVRCYCERNRTTSKLLLHPKLSDSDSMVQETTFFISKTL